MKQTAKHPLGVDARPDNRWGYGMIRPLEALHALYKVELLKMAREQDKSTAEAKISPEFAARLERLKPDDKLRAIVMLNCQLARRY